MSLRSLAILVLGTSVLLTSCSKKEIISEIKKEFTVCNQLADLGNNSIFVQKIQSLYEESKANNFETGYLLYPSATEIFRYTAVKGEPNTASIHFEIEEPLDGFIHCHYNNLYPIFSGSDIKAIYDAYNLRLINDIPAFLCGVVSSTGNAYLLKITNLSQFVSFSKIHLTQTAAFRSFENDYHNRQQNYLATKELVKSFELALLEMIQDSGLTLFKANPMFDNWRKLEKTEIDNLITKTCT